MLEIWKLMHAIHGKSLRPFILLVFLSCGLNVVAYGIQLIMPYNYVGMTMLHLEFPFYAIVVIAFIALLVIHLRFQMRFVKGGGLARMQLLPMRRSTYLLEEAMFILLTIGMLLVGIYVSIGLIYVLHGTALGQVNSGFMYMVLNNDFLINGILPLYADGMLAFVANLFVLSMIYLVFVQSVGNGMLLIENIFLFVGILFLSVIFINSAIEQNFEELTKLANSIAMIVVGIAMFIRMQLAFRSGKIGG